MKTLEPIRVHDVHVSTATVDIQVIRIGSKQMTQAVFRQLPPKDIFDPSGCLLAPPWGWVNFDHDSHGRKFVFSYEGSLYRCSVDLEVHHQLTVRPQINIREVPAHYEKMTVLQALERVRQAGSIRTENGHLFAALPEKERQRLDGVIGLLKRHREQAMRLLAISGAHADAAADEIELKHPYRFSSSPSPQPEEEPHQTYDVLLGEEILQKPTGKWRLLDRWGDDRLKLGLFPDKAAAQQHHAHRLAAVALLEAAPQLFIAV